MENLFGFEENPISVSQLTELIKELLQGTFPSICVEGEISNWKPSSTGHFYFTLKDEKSAINAVMFKFSSKNLTFTPQDGMKVKVTGAISVYEARGTYQIKVNSIEQLGNGNILQILEQRKQKLALEGLFDSERKKKLPFFPKTIGVVTSPTGAALKDILQILSRRNDKISVIVFPCAVQGNEAAQQIANQIKIANEYDLCDVLIVGRGGGSLEDLLPFSEECVVRAVAESHIPTISAVGHEIDWAISDYAADVRASTPSAGAELAAPLLKQIIEDLQKYQSDFFRIISNRIDSCRACVKTFSSQNLELYFRNIETPYLQKFDEVKNGLIQNMEKLINQKKQILALEYSRFEQLNPLAILSRGYSLVYDENGKLISNASQTQLGKDITIALHKGKISAKVTKIKTAE
ncbi:MAG: exodeoxyribonuclease VII large subunit [Treponemataceae bacterium]